MLANPLLEGKRSKNIVGDDLRNWIRYNDPKNMGEFVPGSHNSSYEPFGASSSSSSSNLSWQLGHGAAAEEKGASPAEHADVETPLHRSGVKGPRMPIWADPKAADFRKRVKGNIAEAETLLDAAVDALQFGDHEAAQELLDRHHKAKAKISQNDIDKAEAIGKPMPNAWLTNAAQVELQELANSLKAETEQRKSIGKLIRARERPNTAPYIPSRFQHELEQQAIKNLKEEKLRRSAIPPSMRRRTFA